MLESVADELVSKVCKGMEALTVGKPEVRSACARDLAPPSVQGGLPYIGFYQDMTHLHGC